MKTYKLKIAVSSTIVHPFWFLDLQQDSHFRRWIINIKFDAHTRFKTRRS